MSKKDRRRVFFDVTVDGNLVGRIVMELFNDVAPRTCHNFLMLCTGMAGTGISSGKPLHYKGSTFHRVIKNFMIQGGDFTKGDGTGGESVYGGMFDDEGFVMKHDEPFVLSMANKGPNTNGSQFFITTTPAPHLNNIHVVFGKVVSGQEVVTQIEHLKTNSKNRPLADVVILNCGELVRRKKLHSSKSSESSSSSTPDEKAHKKKKRKKTEKKEKENDEVEHLEIGSAVPEADLHLSSVKPEELPEEPEHHNQYLMRRSKTPEDVKKKEKRKDKSRESPQRISRRDTGQRLSRMRRTRTGHKIKGRGALRFRTPEGSSDRDGSRTPPHWRREQNRLMTLDELHRLQERRKAYELAQAEDPKHIDASDKEKIEHTLSMPRRRESREERHHGKFDRRESRHERTRHAARPSPDYLTRHFVEEKAHRRGDRLENDEGFRHIKREETDKENRDEHRRERTVEKKTAKTDDEKVGDLDELRLEEPADEVTLDASEEVRDSDDEAIRMQLLKAKEKAEEKAKEVPEVETADDGSKGTQSRERKTVLDKGIDEGKRRHRENKTDDRGNQNVDYKARVSEAEKRSKQHRRENESREHKGRSEKRRRNRSPEKSQKRIASREETDDSKEKKDPSRKNQSDVERMQEIKNHVDSNESGKFKVSINGKWDEEDSLTFMADDISKGKRSEAEPSKTEEIKQTDKIQENQKSDETSKDSKKIERSSNRRRSRSSGRRRRSVSHRSRSRDRRLRSRSRSRDYVRRYEGWPRSRRPTRRELYDERMRRERDRRRSLDRRSNRRRIWSRSRRRSSDRPSVRRHSSSPSSSNSDSPTSHSRSTSSSSASSKRSSSSNSSKSSNNGSSD